MAALGLLALFGAACGRAPSFVVVVEAQTLPITKTLAWDAPASDPSLGTVESYTVRLDGTIVGQPTVPTTTQAVTFTTLGTHTLTVTSENVWGSSEPATLTVIVRFAGPPQNPRIS